MISTQASDSISYYNNHYIKKCLHMFIGLVGRVFINGPGDLGSFPGRVITKTLKKGTWHLLA